MKTCEVCGKETDMPFHTCSGMTKLQRVVQLRKQLQAGVHLSNEDYALLMNYTRASRSQSRRRIAHKYSTSSANVMGGYGTGKKR